jgi:signal transduction histidine kinase
VLKTFRTGKVLNSARRNIERLTRIIDNLLDISRIESGRIGIKKKPVDISELARQVAASFGNKARERSILRASCEYQENTRARPGHFS